MQRTKIEWVKNPDGSQGFTSNPISGLCPVECKLPDGRIYCYGRGIYRRKLCKWISDKRVMFWPHRLEKIRKRKKSAGIFMCSTFDLFHPVTAVKQGIDHCELPTIRDSIFETIEACPQHRFYILTKLPQNIDRAMPDNVWLGITITGDDEENHDRLTAFNKIEITSFKKIKFISFEPLLKDIKDPFSYIPGDVEWIIIGKLTQYGRKYDPLKEWIKNLVVMANCKGTYIFMKDNLKEIWGDSLLQEMPR